MNQDTKQIIHKVLEAIGYKDDKEKFTNEFLALCLQKALTNLMEELPQDRQDQLTKRLSLTTPEKSKSILSEYFPKDKFEAEVKEVSQLTFEDYIKSITPTLNDDQKAKLEQHFSSFSST